MDQKIKVGELLSMNSERPGIIHIFENEKITIGRDEQNTIRIDDNRIAHFHCSFFYQDGQVVLKNLSAQGTFLNKERIGLEMEVNLEHGDHIHLLCQKGKKVPEKHVIAYMFYKCEKKKKSARKSSKCHQQILEQISDDLLCIICQELFYESVAVSPCGHVFCGYCLQVWEEKNNTCPICRVKMRNVTKALQVNKIISSVLELNPHIEQIEKPQNKYFLMAGEIDEQSESESQSDSDSYDSDSENENDGRLQLPNPLQNLVVQQIQVRVDVNPPQQQNAQAPHWHNQFEDNNIELNIQVQIQQPPQLQNPIPEMIQQLQNEYYQARIRECKSCNVEYKGFKCSLFQQHTLCFCCDIRMPKRNLNTHENSDLKLFCQVCKNYFCKYYYGQCENVQEHDIQELISYREGFSFQDIYFNYVEQERISRHLDGKDQSTIFDFIVQHYISREQFYIQKNQALFMVVQNDVNELLLPNSPVCQMCIRDVKRQIIFRYVQTFKFEEVEFMMLDCWYGINCRRQYDEQHARSYNHICEQTKFD